MRGLSSPIVFRPDGRRNGDAFLFGQRGAACTAHGARAWRESGGSAGGADPARVAGSGLVIEGGARGNTFGGTTSGAGNIIAFNDSDGVRIGHDTFDAALDNAVLGNSIFGNVDVGINVENTTPQDPPALHGAISGAAGTTIFGTVATTQKHACTCRHAG
jgi:hypothetical protein